MAKAEIQIREAGVEDAAAIARLLHDFNTEYEEPTPPVAELTRHAERMLREGDDGAAGGKRARRPGPAALPPLGLDDAAGGLPAGALRGAGPAGPRHRRSPDAIGPGHLPSRDAAWIELNTGETDIAARNLYRKLGFTNEEGPDGAAMLYYELEI